MPRKQSTDDVAPRVLGAVPLGVTKKVTDAIIREVREQFQRDGRSVTVKAVSFIPSSRTETERGSFQVVANTVIEVIPQVGAAARAEALDSVVTVGRNGRTQTLESLSIPTLLHAAL